MPTLLRPVPFGNSLLDSLPRTARDIVGKVCGPAHVKSGDILCEPLDRIQRVYFPTTAYISLIAPALGTETLEVGMVGNEGIFGITVLLDVKTSPLTGLVQGGGQVLQMSASRFSRLAEDVAPFRKIVSRYLYVLTAQLAQTAACNRFHSLDSRLARWLLTTRDRAQSDTFHLTHKSLAYMLGVRRAGVTEAAGRLQAKKLIRYHHGELTVLDRHGLEEEACSCYIALNAIYEHHLGKPRVASVQPTTHRVP
jgi:CRP-like cAMP-binding protein